MSSLVIFTEQSPVLLRQLRPEHALDYFEAVDANREHLSQFDDDTATKYPDLESVKASIDKPYDRDKLRFGIWASNIFVGSINVRPVINGRDPSNSRAEIGYWLDSRYTGQGYATIALRAVSSYAAHHIGKPCAQVTKGNEASIAVLERAGFTHIRDYDDKHIYQLLETSV